MSEHEFRFGERVRHVKRPEWGVGSVVKCEDVSVNGKPFQRISVRFPNVGVKRLISGHALVQRVEEELPPGPTADNGAGQEKFAHWDRLSESDWLSPVARRKIREAMTSLPEGIRDPFNSLPKRLAATLNLYRFDQSGRGLIDWAIAQSGLSDPLSRFTRQELEELFKRWSVERDAHLQKLLQSASDGSERATVQEVLRGAPPAAREALRRCATMMR